MIYGYYNVLFFGNSDLFDKMAIEDRLRITDGEFFFLI